MFLVAPWGRYRKAGIWRPSNDGYLTSEGATKVLRGMPASELLVTWLATFLVRS
ncbi:hypothetical protein D3C86_2038620 [compost metagenome]